MFRYDPFDSSVVIEGFENGIADSPHQGISNLQNVNIASVPGEASVGFSTSTLGGTSVALAANTVVSVDGSSRLTLASAPAVPAETGMALTFSSVTGYTGVTVGSCYWVTSASLSGGSTIVSLGTNPANIGYVTGSVTITGSGSVGVNFVNMATPQAFARVPTTSSAAINGGYFLADSNGNVWGNKYTTGSSAYWMFMGNSIKNQGVTNTTNGITGSGNGGHNVNDQSTGNGLFVYYGSATPNVYLFVLSNTSVDYMRVDGATNAWTYGWNISKAAGAVSGNTSNQFTMSLGETKNTNHQAIAAPDGRIYFCDWYNVQKLFQTGATAFDPTNTATWTYQTFTLLPYTDIAQSIAPIGVNMLIGGQQNSVYVWDTFSNIIRYPILLPENNIAQIVTVDSNAYIFAGNRGRIYITSGGGPAKLFKKMPDHISNTVEPYFVWGGATFNKNQLYFGVYATTNAATTNANYGGVWAINLDTEALRLVNRLSYGNYDGYATALISNTGVDPAGAGLFIGWTDRIVNNSLVLTSGGLDTTSKNPYTNSIALVESDLIPIGTFNKPRTARQIEYKLVTPMVSGESVRLDYRTDFSQTYTQIFTDSTAGAFSGSWPVNFQNAQWLQIRAILNSTATSPSYVRLKQIRLTGFTDPNL